MKGISFSGKWLKYLAWPGLGCFTAGLVAGSLSGWEPLPIALLIFGIGLLLLGFSFSGPSAGAFWQQRSTQAGTNAIVATIAMLVILGLLNFLAVQNSQRIDLTDTQLFTLAPASEEITQKLDRPVRMVIFDTVRNPRDVQLLESYRRVNSNFSYEYIDPYANPAAVQSFGATQPGMVFLEVGDDRRFLQTVGSGANAESASGLTALSERQITNALDQVVSDRALTVYFAQGHGEPPIDGSATGFVEAVQGLEEKSYEVRPLDLAATQAVPEDASVVVVAGPSQDFFPAEVDALQDYLNAGGGLMLLLNPRLDAGFSPLLDDWGVALDDRIVLDTSGAGQFFGLGPAAPVVTDYGDHPITQEFTNGRSFFPLARPVESTEVPDITATPLLLTNAQSRAEAVSDDGNLTFDPNAPADGPYVLGLALSRPATSPTVSSGAEEPASTPSESTTNRGDTDEVQTDEADEPAPEATTAAPENAAAESPAEPEPTATEETPAETNEETPDEVLSTESRLVVIGNSTFATDGVFNQQLNGDLFLNAVNWLGQQADATLSIRPKTVTDRRIQMTGQQAWGLGIFSLLVLPLTGLALAILMALRRR